MRNITPTPAQSPALMNSRQAAAWLGVCPRTLSSLIANKQIPVVRIGRAVRFRLTDLESFVESRVH